MEDSANPNISSMSDAKGVSAGQIKEEYNIASTSESQLSGDTDGQEPVPKRRFISWGQYKSKDKDRPDVLIVIPQDTDTIVTQYSTCARVAEKEVLPSTSVSSSSSSRLVDKFLPLHSHKSPNLSLIRQWRKGWATGRLKVGKAVKIHTWLDVSRNDRSIRRSRLVY